MNAPANIGDAPDLPAIVARARALLDDDDVFYARLLARQAYAGAKTAAAEASRFEAGRALVGKARRLQGEALLIEAQAQMRIADEYDAAQAAGKASKGRPKTLPDGKTFTVEQAGLSHKEIHQARKLRDAEKRDPGIAERAIAARLEQGLEPTRANLRVAIGTDSASKGARGDNFYETPREAVLTLLANERFLPRILEPACGRGAISSILEAAGHELAISDLVDRGCATRHGELQGVADFLTSDPPDDEDGDFSIISNPPYGEVLNAFLAHALRRWRPKKMAMLLNLNALAGFDNPDRNFVMDEWPPARIHVFKRRLPMMHRDGWDGPIAESRMNTAWFVWERVAAFGGVTGARRPYGGQTIIFRRDWKDFIDWKPKEGWRT